MWPPGAPVESAGAATGLSVGSNPRERPYTRMSGAHADRAPALRMSGLLRRLTRRRSTTADENRSPSTASSEPAAAPAETPAEPGGQQPVPAQPATARDLPAGVDPHDLATAPAASARRGKLRRRLRYLRHVRELLLRDLGGFTYEVHRTAGGTAQEGHRRLASAKASRIAALDAEVRAIEARLGEPH